MTQEEKERAEWALGDYDNGEDGCPHCKRMRLCKCDNGMHITPCFAARPQAESKEE